MTPFGGINFLCLALTDILTTVKSFISMGTQFHCLTMIDMFMDNGIPGFQIIRNIT